ncbi:MAG: SGNH/GDSL hydrolase family protein [Flavobacteriales bacterium]
MKLLLFTDSLSLPRNTPETCTHAETWPELLRQQGHEVCLSAMGGATIKELYRQTFYFQHGTYFDAVIVQAGIVDCAPRFAHQWETKGLQKIPRLGKSLLGLLNTKNVRNFRKITYTKPREFASYVDKFSTAFPCPMYFIEILPALPAYENQLPGVGENIKKYNAILKPYAPIGTMDFPSDGLMTDYHHMNAKGHRYLFEQITKQLNGGLS